MNTPLLWAAATVLIKSKLPPSCKKRLYCLLRDLRATESDSPSATPVSIVTKILA